MSRLFAGTPWDRPPTCARCGRLESECACPPPDPDVKRVSPEQQTARLTTERRPKGKLVTVIKGLDPSLNDLSALATRLKNACGAGGTEKDGQIELQGDHLKAAERTLQAIGYKTTARCGPKGSA
jgi:translation initiation factor 1